MNEYAVIFAGALRRAAVRGALTATALSALVLAGLFAPGDTQGAGTFNVDGSVTKIEAYYDGACDAGTLTESISSTDVGVVNVSGPISGCFGTEDAPSVVLVDQELIAYANVHTNTASAVSAELPAPFTLVVDNTAGFPSGGHLYVNLELMTYDSKTTNTFHITGRAQGEKGVQTHLIGTFVRAEGTLNLRARGLPRYAWAGSESDPPTPPPPEALTAQASHYSGADVKDPKVYLTCRGRLWQSVGSNSIFSRSRCYAILEPGYSPKEPYWPDDPYPGPVLSLKDEFWHELSAGEINEGTGELTLVTEYGGSQCFEYIEDEAWFQISTSVFLDKVPFNEDRGDFVTYFYDDEDCTEPTAWLEGTDNFGSTEIPSDTDTDGDWCPDGNELDGNQQEGGLRDPLNPWDYMNPTADGQNRVDDILAVVNQYFVDVGDPGYDEGTDRTSLVPGPAGWNLGPPNGQQRVDDILASVKSYFHDCGPDHSSD